MATQEQMAEIVTRIQAAEAELQVRPTHQAIEDQLARPRMVLMAHMENRIQVLSSVCLSMLM